MILDAATFTPGAWLSGAFVANIRSSASPDAASQSLIYYRLGIARDPLVSVDSGETNTIYWGNSNTSPTYAALLSQATSFGGFSVWLRQSPATEVDFCLSAVSSACFVPMRTMEEEILIGQQNTLQEISPKSNLQKQLSGCSYSSCLLYEQGCATSSNSAVISIQGVSPWKISVDAASLPQTEWQETQCVVCQSGVIFAKIDSIVFKRLKYTGVCGWIKVRNLPSTATAWYPFTDQLAGNVA